MVLGGYGYLAFVFAKKIHSKFVKNTLLYNLYYKNRCYTIIAYLIFSSLIQWIKFLFGEVLFVCLFLFFVFVILQVNTSRKKISPLFFFTQLKIFTF